MKEFSLSNVLLFHLHGNEGFNQVCYCEAFFGVFSIKLKCIYLSLFQSFAICDRSYFLNSSSENYLFHMLPHLHCCTCIPIIDILPLSLDFKKSETNDRALSRTAAPRHQSGITFPDFHCSRKAPAEQFRGDLSSLEKPSEPITAAYWTQRLQRTRLVCKAGGRCTLFINSVIWVP